MEGKASQLPERFNVRVYGLLVHEGKVLISRETIGGMRITKFPGGGLEFGEGIGAALVREFDEELGLPVELGPLFYINDFLQISAFDPADQLLAVYYIVSPLPSLVWDRLRAVDTYVHEDNGQKFEWVPIPRLGDAKISFPVDKKVAALLAET